MLKEFGEVRGDRTTGGAMTTADRPTILLSTDERCDWLRRPDVEAKQSRIQQILKDIGCDYLLLLEPANIRWASSGAFHTSRYSREDMPALYINHRQRWLVCNNVDTQRLFDEELDGMGFQVKEWPWHASREQFINDLCSGRRVACDRPFRDCSPVGLFLDRERQTLSMYEQLRTKELGREMVHALEAAARNFNRGETEEEIAGHLSHRLLRHGVEPVSIQVTADCRGGTYRRARYGATKANRSCVLTVTAEKFGLHITASRTTCFGEPDPILRQGMDMACRLSGVWLAYSKLDQPVQIATQAGKALLRNTAYEFEWRNAPWGWWTGRETVESFLTPSQSGNWQTGHCVVWQARLGPANVCDTFLLGDEGWQNVTPILEWPTRRVIVQGRPFDRPDILVRDS